LGRFVSIGLDDGPESANLCWPFDRARKRTTAKATREDCHGGRRFGGRGNDATCPVCGEVVTPIQAAIELEFNRHGPKPGLDQYHLHARCFTAWESERRKIPGSET